MQNIEISRLKSHNAHLMRNTNVHKGKSNQIKSKKNLYSAVYSTDSEALGGRIK